MPYPKHAKVTLKKNGEEKMFELDLTKEENREFLENAIRYFALMGYTVIVELKLVEGDTL